MRKWIYTVFSILLLVPSLAFAQLSVDETGLHETAEPIFGGVQKTMDIGQFLGTFVINPLFALSGVIFLVLIIYGGILWMTDIGNSEQVSKAKKLLVHSTVGLIIISGAFAITNLLLEILNNTSGPTSP